MNEQNPIKLSIEKNVAIITIDRAERLGALTQAMRVEITRHIREQGASESGVRGIVLTGTGRAFSAGEDLQEITVSDASGLVQAVETFHDITRAILQAAVPVVAALNGLAVGGASEVAMSCDARIGAPDAAFLMPENGLGITISNASSLFLRRLTGSHAMRIVLASPRIEAAEALRIGLLDEIVPQDELLQKAIELVHEYNPEGSACEQHLKLLRPTIEEVEAAITRENVAAESAWQSGITQAGVRRFWANKTKV